MTVRGQEGYEIAGAPVVFDERGLVPVIAQDAETGEVLMLAYATRRALELTLETGRAHYHSRSRGELWRKGDSSGNVQRVAEVAVDCDGDAVLYRVHQTGPACHTGARSCFYRGRALEGGAGEQETATSRSARLGSALDLLEGVVASRLAELPEGSYVASLHDRGPGYVAQKVVEEAGETIVAALAGEREDLVSEAADLLFHLTVLLHEKGLGLEDVATLLEERHRARGTA